MRKMMAMQAGPKADSMIEAFRKAHPQATPSDVVIGLSTYSMMRAPSITLAERKAAQNAAPVYMYLFTYETDVFGGKLKSPHGLEIPFVFDNVDTVQMAGSKPDKIALAKQMSGAWAAFAHTGKPDFGGVAWKPYTAQHRATMIFDTKTQLVDDPEQAERLALR